MKASTLSAESASTRSVVVPVPRTGGCRVSYRVLAFVRLSTGLPAIHGLTGWVRNCTGQVEITATGDAARLQVFEHELIKLAPPISQPRIESCEQLPYEDFGAFRIRDSEASEITDIHVPPDYFVCDQCRAEMNDPNDRRFHYPFINCTQCGPRYTLIEALPYDRASTSMAGFQLCAACQKEYADVSSRRFHAEPVACPECGPGLSFHQDDRRIDSTGAALSACVQVIRQGGIVAVKGVGGYHLLCDASDAAAVGRLRARKPRPHKPLALMIPEDDALDQVHAVIATSAEEDRLLHDPQRPVVVCRRHPNNAVSEAGCPRAE